MKYIGILLAVTIQGVVMLGDVVLFGVFIALISFTWPNPVTFSLAVAVISLTLGLWNRTGAFEAWRPKVMKALINNFRLVFT